MRKLFVLLLCSTAFLSVYAQPPRVPLYSINNIPLPAEMDKQVCISGLVYHDNSLYFASERCPFIKVTDLSGTITRTINFQVPNNFEMEGLTAMNDNLYLVSENLAAVYSVNIKTGAFKQVQTSIPLPEKTKGGDGMEGIAANKTQKRFYLLRERNEDMTRSQLYTFSVDENTAGDITLKYDSMIELPLENPQWRYSDICYDAENSRLILLKSYSKGKLRQQFIESMDIDQEGKLKHESLKDIPVQDFSTISNQYKVKDYSMNLEGVTLDSKGNIFIVSDNTSGKAQCDQPAREKTILLQLKKTIPQE